MELFFPPEVVAAVNTQINNELYSAYLYQALAEFCDAMNLPGFAHWHKMQANEETTHARKFMTYITDSDAFVTLETIQQPSVPQMAITDALETFRLAYEHELKVTEMLRGIASLALNMRDFRTFAFMDWFLLEQIEECGVLQEIIARYQLNGGESLLEKELGERK
jgi:ferritin